MAADPRDADGVLLDALAVTLRPPAAEPSRAELAALQRVVTATAPGLAARRIQLRRRLVAVAAVVVVGSGSTALATSPRAPREVRVVAHAIKLPVEAPDVTDARRALDDLEAALDAVPVRLDHVRDAVAGVERELAELGAGDRAGLSLRATTLLERARALLAPPPPPVPADDDRSGTSDDRASDDGVGARELNESSRSDSSGSGGSGSSGSDSSGSGSVDADDLDGTSGSSGSSGSTGSEPGSDDSSDHTGSGSGDDD